MLNPCCCISPRIGTFICGIIDLIFSVSSLSYVLSREHYTSNRWVEIAVCVIMIIFAVLLIWGAVKNSIEKLQIWLVGWIVIVILIIVSQVFNLFSDHSRGYENARVGSNLASVLFFLYEAWIVYAFIHELQYGSGGLTYCPTQVV